MERRAFVGTAAGLLIAPLAATRAADDKGRASATCDAQRANRPTSRRSGSGCATSDLSKGRPAHRQRYANGDAARLPDLARELIKLNVQVLVVTEARPCALSDVVDHAGVGSLIGDPCVLGVARSLDHPGGNMTGLTTFNVVLPAKRLQLLREVVPATRVGVLNNPSNPAPAAQAESLKLAARSLGIDLMRVNARSPGELDEAFAKMSQAGVTALLVENDAMFFSQRVRIADLAARQQLPVVYGEREFADVGGLMAYAASGTANFRRAATYVDKILKGTKPGDLPVEQPTKIELVINLKAANALSLTIPQAVLLRADEVIQ